MKIGLAGNESIDVSEKLTAYIFAVDGNTWKVLLFYQLFCTDMKSHLLRRVSKNCKNELIRDIFISKKEGLKQVG
jgi:hypothetical protein